MPQIKQDAIDLLKADHRHIVVLFKVFDKLKDKPEEHEACAAIIESSCMELRMYGALMQELFYPIMREPADEVLWSHLDEGSVKHQTIEALIDKIDLLDPADPMYKASFGVLAEYVKRHLDEEEKNVFPRARQLKKLNLCVLGALMQARKDELLEQTAEIHADLHEEAETLRAPLERGVAQLGLA